MFNKTYLGVVTGASYSMYFCTPTAIKNDELLEEKTEMETQSDGNQRHSGLQDFGCFNDQIANLAEKKQMHLFSGSGHDTITF